MLSTLEDKAPVNEIGTFKVGTFEVLLSGTTMRRRLKNVSLLSVPWTPRTVKKLCLRRSACSLHRALRVVHCARRPAAELYVGKLRQPRVCNIYNITPTREGARPDHPRQQNLDHSHLTQFGHFRCCVSKACKSPMVLPAPIQCSTHDMSFSLPNPPTFHAPN